MNVQTYLSSQHNFLPLFTAPFFGLNLPKKVSVKTTATCEAKKKTCPTCFELFANIKQKSDQVAFVRVKNFLSEAKKK